jgi:hypothetical protein
MRDFFPILEIAFKKGTEALKNCKPTPVRFFAADLNDKPLEVGRIDDEGNCGGACIKGIAYNSELYKFFKKHGKSNGMGGLNAEFTLSNKIRLRKDVYKGYSLHFPTYDIYNGQSHERYKAFYQAVVEVLKEEGVSCRVYDYLT